MIYRYLFGTVAERTHDAIAGKNAIRSTRLANIIKFLKKILPLWLSVFDWALTQFAFEHSLYSYVAGNRPKHDVDFYISTECFGI